MFFMLPAAMLLSSFVANPGLLPFFLPEEEGKVITLVHFVRFLANEFSFFMAMR
jgi:hypothetical protein